MTDIDFPDGPVEIITEFNIAFEEAVWTFYHKLKAETALERKNEARPDKFLPEYVARLAPPPERL